MPRHYTTRNFLRQMPSAPLGRYFQLRGVADLLGFPGANEKQPARVFDAWLRLPPQTRTILDTECQEIFAMSCDTGVKAIIDEAEWKLTSDVQAWTAFVKQLAALTNHYERAMVTFLDHNRFWRGATHFYHADILPYWRKRKNLPHLQAAVDPASLDALARGIGKYFHEIEGRGQNCVVEPYRREPFDYFFAYPEDYSRHSVEWVEGRFDRRPHNPAFEVIYVYSQHDGTLDINVRGANHAAGKLQDEFAKAILKVPKLPDVPKDTRVYDLNPLRHRGFEFVYPPESGIQRVALRKLRLSSTAKKGDRVTFEANAADDADAVYRLLAKVDAARSLALYNVTQVELAASVQWDATQPAKTVTIGITYPNFCSLKYDDVDLKLRAMLTASGIEPK